MKIAIGSAYILCLLAAVFPPRQSHAYLLPQIDSLTQSDIMIAGARWAGEAVCTTGDVNGDGIADIAVTANGTEPYDLYNAGSAYIYFGRREIPNVVNPMVQADITINGSHQYGNLGDSISTSGDVNGDGICDILIGASDLGTAYLFFGRTDIAGEYDADNDADVILYGGGWFGDSLEIGGDVNGDGLHDVIVSAYGADPNGKDGAGAAYLFYGRGSWPATLSAGDCDVKFIGAQAGDNLGWSVSCGGDVNGDGLADVVLGAPSADRDGQVNRGAGYVIYGRSNLPVQIDVEADSDILLTTIERDDAITLGDAVCNSGDVNNDGINDVIIAAGAASPKSYKEGETYIIFGSASMPGSIDVKTAADVRISGSFDSEISGRALSSGGDVNGDGIDDFMIGSSGKAYCLLGRHDWPPVLDMGVEADSVLREYYLFGESVCNGGDVNGDGMADIIVGDSLGGPEWASGAAYVVYGSPLPLDLRVQRNVLRSDNDRVFHAGEVLMLEYSVYPAYGTPRFDEGQKLQAALGVQHDPSWPDPTGGGQIYVYEPGLKQLTPMPDDPSGIIPTFGNVSFPPLPSPLVGTVTFTVPSNAKGEFCFIGTIYEACNGAYPAGIVRSNRFRIE